MGSKSSLWGMLANNVSLSLLGDPKFRNRSAGKQYGAHHWRTNIKMLRNTKKLNHTRNPAIRW